MARTMGWLAGAAGAVALARVRRHRVAGKAVLVSGGSRGLGLCIARELARRGARLAIAARDVRELEAARVELAALGAEVVPIACDVASEEDAARMVREAEARLGRVDALVNVAGIIQVAPAEGLRLQDYRDAVGVNFWGTVHATLAALPAMRARGDGAVLNVTSIGGAVAVPHLLPYTAGKFAQVGFSEGIAAEAAKDGVRVTTVVPGLMRTGSFLRALFKGRREAEVGWFAVASSLPLLTVGAGRAARRMVDALERGERYVVVGWPARALRLLHALLPGATIRAMALANRLLPSQGGVSADEPAREGHAHRPRVARSFLTALGDAAAARNRERPREA
ncbi:SDR family NAD(P)-dependent oxidoreductase [Anaeromyxobacter paludicola]|uniref:SDR family NAD(P)-dependent oxidoreductase n=1 Tax=Anaeromyxobacter paludicola TaxID=2918171 RepID=UPI0020C18087|nr:SDR family oxidoreductase [Anaeromyxobacter paludicola]